MPCVGNGVEVVARVVDVIHAIVELYRLVPVVYARRGIEVVVACSLGWEFGVWFSLTCIGVDIWLECCARTIVKIIGSRKTHRCIVVLAKVAHPFGLGRRMILACYVVWHKIDDHLQSGTMASVKKLFKFLHTIVDIVGQVGVNVVIIDDGIG